MNKPEHAADDILLLTDGRVLSFHGEVCHIWSWCPAEPRWICSVVPVAEVPESLTAKAFYPEVPF